MSDPKKILLVTDEKFFAQLVEREIADSLGRAEVTTVDSSEALALKPEALKQYAAIVQMFPHAIGDIFPEDSPHTRKTNFEAAVPLLKDLRLKAPNTPIICCCEQVDDANPPREIQFLKDGLNAQQITFSVTSAPEVLSAIQSALNPQKPGPG